MNRSPQENPARITPEGTPDGKQTDAGRRRAHTRAAGAVSLVALLAGLTSVAATPPAAPPEPAFRAAEAPARPRARRPQVVRERYVRFDRTLLGSRVHLNLFPDIAVIARRVRAETSGPDGNVWIGRTEEGDGAVFLSTVRGVTVGDVQIGHRQFEIRDVDDGLTVISEIDSSQFPPEGCEDPGHAAPEYEAAPLVTESIASDPCNIIDVMIVYTPSVLNAYGSAEAVEALIHLAISKTNASYETSGITTRLTPVYIGEVDYEEAILSDPNADVFDDRDFLIDPADNVLDEVPVLRDEYCADMVMLLTHWGGEWCGAARIMDPAPDPAHESKAFGVTVDDCSATNLTLAHEFGHMQGARHDWYVSGESTPYTYAHGYVNRADGWRTIMAYNTECDDLGLNCSRKPVFSNPGIFVQGTPAGVPSGTSTSCTEGDPNHPACDAENWRTLNNTDCTVANFRDRSQCVGSASSNVWMKDSWNDTGLEPDPRAFGDDMWLSPYIWVRNQQDLTGEHQHQHQNPEASSTNYVYVKLHNDFSTTATGRLKLYYADSSLWMTWPGDWTLLSDDAVAIAPHATLIWPSTWTPAAAGDYALLARWDTPTSPADPMAFPEGSSVSLNARGNNNIVWRNTQAVNLLPDFPIPMGGVKAANPNPVPKSLDIAIELPDDPNNFVLKGGEILFDLGNLLDVWQSAGGRGDGVQIIDHPVYGKVVQVDPATRGAATMRGIPMEPFQSEDVRLILTAPRIPPPPPFPPTTDDPPEPSDPTGGGDTAISDSSHGTFWIGLVELDGTERVGGVGYEIEVEPTAGSGAVPDGGAVPGAPLTVTLERGILQLDWDASCSAADTDYAIYEGDLGDFTSHLPVACSTGGLTDAAIPLPTGSKYYVIAPTDGFTDGSYGLKSNGVERPASLAACRPHAVGACAP